MNKIKENLKKLPQLSRIEYMLRRKEIGELKFFPAVINTFGALFQILIYLAIVTLLVKLAAPTYIKPFLDLTFVIIDNVKFILILALACDITATWLTWRGINKLNKEFKLIDDKK